MNHLKTGFSFFSPSAYKNYKYQGQELQETGFYSFKWRNYMPDVARFFNVDPLSEKYPTWTPYAFSGNRVIDARELEGLEPYVLFGSMDKAAENFGMQYNGISINVNREYVTKFYSETDASGNVNYAYVTPVQGGPAGATPSSVTLPTGKTEEGIAHSHGAYDVNYDNNNFSGIPGDKTGSDDIGYSERHNIPIYVATPNGSFQKYNNTNDTISTLRTDLPSDANDPARLNTINPAPMLQPPPPTIPPPPVTTP